MHEMAWSTLVILTLLIIRWGSQGLLAPPREIFSPQLFVLQGLLLLNYWVIAGLALFLGQIKLVSIIILATAVLLRLLMLCLFRLSEKNSFFSELNTWLSQHQTPLILFLIEIIAFVLALPWSPLILLMLFLMNGVICGWYAHVKEMLRITSMETTQPLFDSQKYSLLRLFFPRNPRLIDNTLFSYDTYAMYTWIGASFGTLIGVSYGINFFLIILMFAGIWLGSAILDRFTTRNINYPKGYAFQGGVIGALIVLFSYYLIFNLPIWPALNAITVACAVSQPLGRLGCLGHGCCSGKFIPQYRSYMIAYHHPQHKINRVRQTPYSYCYPSVVIEALLQSLIAIACILWSEYAFIIWLISYGSIRILLQPWRFRSKVISFYLLSGISILAGIILMLIGPAPAIPPLSHLTLFQILAVIVISFVVSALYGLRLKSKIIA